MANRALLVATLLLVGTEFTSAYIFPDVILDRAAAQAYCQANFGLDLAKADTQADAQTIRDVAITRAGKHTYIGLYDKNDDTSISDWLWEDNSTPAQIYWLPGEPQNSPANVERCVIQHSNPAHGVAWLDIPCSYAGHFVCGIPSSAVQVCTVPDSEWLETEFAPELLTVPTGFTTGVKDLFRIEFTYHRKYFGLVASSDGLGFNAPTVAENSPTDCYNTYTIDVAWGTLVPKCARSEEGGASGFVVYTCKLELDAQETLAPIRGNSLTREIHNSIPFMVKFPKQVTASVSQLTAAEPANVLAAVIAQRVSLDVSDPLDVDAKIRLFTSVQWPFKLLPSSSLSLATPAQVPSESFVNVVDCADPNVADTSNPTVDDANACSQEWLLDLQVNAAQRCDIDGNYKVSMQAVCQPSFAAQTDCPLVKDDLGVADDVFEIDFVIDSEKFCAQVVDSVDLAASMAVFKDHAHSIDATNFIEQQTAYFVVTAVSDKVTIVKAAVYDIDLDITGGAAAGHYDLVSAGATTAQGAAVSLVVENSDDAANGNPAQAWFQFVVDAATFDAPADGSADFDVTAVLDVYFKDALGAVVLERQTVQLLQGEKNQAISANVRAGLTSGDEADASSSAPAVAAGSVLALAASVATVAL